MTRIIPIFTFCAAIAVSSTAMGGVVFVFSDGFGLSAEAEFTRISDTVLQIRYKNTSTGLPPEFLDPASDQILSGVSFDFGAPGFNGDTMITGGSVVAAAKFRGVEGGNFKNASGFGAAVPEPSTFALFGIGLLALVHYGRRRIRRTAS